jgi:hypothetical protein
MINKIFSLLVVAAGSVYLTSCDNNEDAIKTFNSLVDVSNTSIEADKFDVVTVFSTDGGATFVDYPVIKKGETYMVKAVNHHTGLDLTTPNCFDVDWSTSDPQPDNVSEGVATFTMGTNGSLVGKVTDYVAPYDASAWVGTIIALEDYGSATWGPYEVVLTQDGTNPNRFHLDNFYDSGLPAFIDFDGAAGTVKFPDGQSPGGKALTNSSGTFNQCAGSFEISLNYDGGDWLYHFTK